MFSNCFLYGMMIRLFKNWFCRCSTLFTISSIVILLSSFMNLLENSLAVCQVINFFEEKKHDVQPGHLNQILPGLLFGKTRRFQKPAAEGQRCDRIASDLTLLGSSLGGNLGIRQWFSGRYVYVCVKICVYMIQGRHAPPPPPPNVMYPILTPPPPVDVECGCSYWFWVHKLCRITTIKGTPQRKHLGLTCNVPHPHPSPPVDVECGCSYWFWVHKLCRITTIKGTPQRKHLGLTFHLILLHFGMGGMITFLALAHMLDATQVVWGGGGW